jgi:acyl-CoA-binding protein
MLARMTTPADLEAAVRRVNALTSAPSTDDMLALYGLYKQATTGDATGDRPGMFDLKGRAKFDAWAKHRGLGAEAARAAYVALVDRLAGR